MTRLSFVAFASVLGLAAGCGSDSDSDSGIEYYSGTASAALGISGNESRCATCHSADGSIAGFSGVTFKDIAFRSSYKGGMAPDLLAASNACVTGWMGGAALTESDEKWQKLEAYLVSISNTSVTTPNAIAPEVLANEAAYETAYAGGDAAAGAAKYAASCGNCHDGGLRVGARGAIPKAAIRGITVGRIAQKVRTSGPPPSGMSDPSDSTPGPMPFFELAELPVQDLKDIIAHVRQ